MKSSGAERVSMSLIPQRERGGGVCVSVSRKKGPALLTDCVRREGVEATTILGIVPATRYVALSRTMHAKVSAGRGTPA